MKIQGLEGMTTGRLQAELSAGGRFVYFQYCISVVFMTYRRSSDVYYVPPDRSGVVLGLRYTLLSLIAGWWGFPWGPIYTIAAVSSNIAGGTDVTAQVTASIQGLTYTPSVERPSVAVSHAKGIAITLGSLAFIVLAVFWGISFYKGTHHTLHVINGFSAPAKVWIGKSLEIAVPPGGRTEVCVGEGRLDGRWALGSRPAESFQAEIREGYWERIWGSPVYVLSVGGGAVLARETSLYSANPNPKDVGDYKISIPNPFGAFSEIDYPFEPFPKTIQVSDQSSRTAKCRLDMEKDSPENALQGIQEGSVSQSDMLGFAERHILADPGNEALLMTYAVLGSRKSQGDRCTKFLAPGLAKRPVDIAWHRAYQTALAGADNLERLRKEYDAFLQASPADANLLYLRGRFEPFASRSIAFMERATSLDPTNGHAWMAMSFSLISLGRFGDSARCAARAIEDKATREQASDLAFKARLAAGDLEGLRRDSLAGFQTAQTKYSALNKILVVAAASKDRAGAQKAIDAWASATGANTQERDSLRNMAQAYFRYYSGDLEGMFASLKDLPSVPIFNYLRAQGYLASLKPERAAKLKGDLWPSSEGVCDLLLALGYQAAHQDPPEAALSNARAVLSGGTTEERMAAGLLAPDARDVLSTAQDLDFYAEDKAVILTALAWVHPNQRAPLLALARKLDFNPTPPHAFLRVAADGMEKGGWPAPAAQRP